MSVKPTAWAALGAALLLTACGPSLPSEVVEKTEPCLGTVEECLKQKPQSTEPCLGTVEECLKQKTVEGTEPCLGTPEACAGLERPTGH